MITGIVQARMGSTRLPGKVLMTVGDKTILEHCMNRLSLSSKVDRWILATTDEPEDDVIAHLCKEKGISFFRGPMDDVLSRYYHAALSLQEKPETIIRVCCDNPTHHGEVVDYCIDEFSRYGVDYFSNGNEPPQYTQDGITTEVFTFESLSAAYHEAVMSSEREHVTPYIKKSGKFRLAWRKFADDFHFKLSVDTATDLEINRELFARLHPLFTIDELSRFLAGHPEVAQKNAGAVFNEGYLKSVKEDKRIR